MKKMFLILCMGLIAASCGSKSSNKVDSGAQANGAPAVTTPVTNEVTIPNVELSAFTGSYEVSRRDIIGDCAETIRVVTDCNGLKVLEYGYHTAEEFCNINKGASRLVMRTDDRNPPNPDRNPPNPDNNPPEIRTVTLRGNEVKSVLTISDRVSFTNSLKIDGDVLLKTADLKSRKSRCIYTRMVNY